MSANFWRRAACVACVFMLSVAGAAQQGEELSLREAMARALRQHPQLRGFVFETHVLEGERAIAERRPQPQLDLSIDDMAGTGAHGGFAAAESTLSLSQLIELGGKRGGRVALAEAGRAGLQTQQAARQLDVLAEVARRFVALLDAQARVQIATQGVALAEGAQSLVQRRVQAASAPPAESTRAGIQVWEARFARDTASRELDAARHMLAAAMGEQQPTFARAQGELLRLAPTIAFDTLVRRLDATPELLRFADEARVHDAELRLAQMQRRPDIRATLGLRRYEQSDELALVAGISVPLFAARTAAAQIDIAQARREQTGAERDAAVLALQARLFALHAQLERARQGVNLLQTELLPQLQAALEQTAYAYERGRYSYLEWTVAQRELLDGRRRLVEFANDFHVMQVEIERLTGASLEPDGANP